MSIDSQWQKVKEAVFYTGSKTIKSNNHLRNMYTMFQNTQTKLAFNNYNCY